MHMYLLKELYRASRIRNLGTRFFLAPNNMFAYTIVHLIFCAPEIVVCARMYAKVYLAVCICLSPSIKTFTLYK